MYQKTLDEKIREIKDQIADCKDYISSDFCTSCMEMYKKIAILEQQLKYLENERTNHQS